MRGEGFDVLRCAGGSSGRVWVVTVVSAVWAVTAVRAVRAAL